MFPFPGHHANQPSNFDPFWNFAAGRDQCPLFARRVPQQGYHCNGPFHGVENENVDNSNNNSSNEKDESPFLPNDYMNGHRNQMPFCGHGCRHRHMGWRRGRDRHCGHFGRGGGPCCNPSYPYPYPYPYPGPPPFGFAFLHKILNGHNQHHQNQNQNQEQDQQETQTEVFTPKTDIFTTPHTTAIHISLPGAKKQDINITYNPAQSLLRVTGIVLRPGVDEEMYSGLVLDERGAGEVGVFERVVDLSRGMYGHFYGDVDVDGISARLEDGVLVVVFPRVVGKKAVVDDEEKEKNAAAATTVDVDSGTEKGDDDSSMQDYHDIKTPVDSEGSDFGDGGEYVRVHVE